ncbi:MAG: hypothetical protein ACRDDZ_13050 [Marinifilaceae bacterium]
MGAIAIFEIILLSVGMLAVVLMGIWFIVYDAILKRDHARKSAGYSTQPPPVPSQHQETLQTQAHSQTHIEKRMENMEGYLEQIANQMAFLSATLAPQVSNDVLTRTDNLLRLTTSGLRLVQDYGLYAIITESYDRIQPYLTDITTTEPHELQQYFIDICSTDTKQITGSENYKIIVSMSKELEIPITSTERLLAVLIRDIYFKEHGIVVE